MESKQDILSENDDSCEAYLRRHHLGVYLNDAVCQALSNQKADPATSFADYLLSVIQGGHVVGREFAFISATPFNRRCFVHAAKELLENIKDAGPVTIGDCHSALRFLCPDFPLGSVKNAWNTALGIHVEGAATPEESSLRRQADRLPFHAFLTCFEITFIFERYLMDVRKTYFDVSKHCVSFTGITDAIREAQQWSQSSGWPVPALVSLEHAILVASEGGAQPNFEFRKFVRALCCHDECRRELELDNSEVKARCDEAVSLIVGSRSELDVSEKGCTETPRSKKRSGKSRGTDTKSK